LTASEQLILKNWYSSLINKGTLRWNVDEDLCGQTGIKCVGFEPQNVINM